MSSCLFVTCKCDSAFSLTFKVISYNVCIVLNAEQMAKPILIDSSSVCTYARMCNIFI